MNSIGIGSLVVRAYPWDPPRQTGVVVGCRQDDDSFEYEFEVLWSDSSRTYETVFELDLFDDAKNEIGDQK